MPLEILLDMTPITHEEGGVETEAVAAPAAAASPPATPTRGPSADRAEELMEKFRVLLASPMAEGIARIIEESFRLLPIIPPPSAGDAPLYASASEIEAARRGRSRSRNPV